jgi:hypothetical protein
MHGNGNGGKEVVVRGWPALIIILIFVTTGAAYRIYLHRNLQLDPQARKSIESSITASVYRGLLRKEAEGEDLEELGRQIAGTKVEVHDMKMRGSSDEIVVRARYSIHRPDTTETRIGYFKCSHSFLMGWTCEYEVSIWRWYIEFF